MAELKRSLEDERKKKEIFKEKLIWRSISSKNWIMTKKRLLQAIILADDIKRG
jgi:hypothetical protein